MLAIELKDVSVRYRLPKNGLRSLKESVVLALQRQLAFDEFTALRGVSLNVQPGERLGIVGRNGAGKSTLLQVIAQVVQPSSGMVVTRGAVAPLLELGAGFDTELTGRENIFLNGAILGVRRSELSRRFDEIVDFADLHPFIDVPLRAYSSGMTARLGFAIAMAAQPSILLLDEVFSVGDEEFRTKCEARLSEFSQSGVTVLLASHDPSLILEQCSRAIWIEAGEIRATGSPPDVMGAYHAFIAQRASGVDGTNFLGPD
jgi:ABC-type polysaccharide/polyol phosphate transport system ATPase subunit